MIQNTFTNALHEQGFSAEKSLELWKIIEKAYSKATSFYHNLSHIKAMLGPFADHKNQLQQPAEFLMAIFFHDVVYDIKQDDNEEKSAQLAAQLLADAKNLDINQVKSLILSTKNHQAEGEDQKYLIDFDLQILGSSPENYQAYTQKIRKEYRAMANKIYQPARKVILESFLQQDYIYHTKAFRDLYEAQARENIQAEILTLS